MLMDFDNVMRLLQLTANKGDFTIEKIPLNKDYTILAEIPQLYLIGGDP